MGVRMKRLILSSIFCLAFAGVSNAQEKHQPQIIVPPEKLFEFPKVAPNAPGKGLDWWKELRKQDAQARVIELKGLTPAQGGVCSVPLLEAHAETVDPGMAFTPQSTAVPIPQARVPAPACQKK
jgi:hypothetical protein